MNKILKTAAVACFAISAASADSVFWELDTDGGGNQSGGYWYTYGDEKEDGGDGKGGCTKTDFPPGSDIEDVVGPEWQARSGAVSYMHNTGCTYKYPFAGIGSNWFDPKATVATQGEDPLNGVTAIKVYYNLSTSAPGVACKVELGADGATGYNNPTVALTVGDNLSVGKSFATSAFKQASGWGTQGVTWAQAVQASDALKFKCEFTDVKDENATATLTLRKIEFIGGGGVPTLPSNSASPAKLSLANNALSISGINSDVKVDIVSLHGALVSSGVIGVSKPLSLSNLPSGVYMVRVNSLNLTQKVVVK